MKFLVYVLLLLPAFSAVCSHRRWDFSCHPVSVFSYRLLDQIWKVPLFRVPDLSKVLYSKVRALRLAHLRRTQLKYVHDFINTCRFADE